MKLRMTQEYVPENTLSTVPQYKWRLALWGLGGTIFGGSILVIFLAFGAANPPRAGALVWEADSAGDWPLTQYLGEFELYRAPIPLPPPPFTLELIADNSGRAASAWGVWLRSSDTIYTFLVSREGYMSVSDDEVLHWAEFMHIQNTRNKIYVDVATDFRATLRINDELAWRGTLAPGDDRNWGMVQYQEPLLSWQGIAVYAP